MREGMGQDRISTLKQKHEKLATELQYLERRAFLTPTEQREASVLKKEKLLCKDELHQLIRDT